MIVWRLISTGIIVLLLALLAWLDLWLGDHPAIGISGLIALPITLLIAYLAVGEVVWLQDSFETQPNPWLVNVATLVVVASAFLPMFWLEYPQDCSVGMLGWPLFGLTLATGIVLTVEMINYRKPGSNTLRIALALFAVCYVGLLLSFVGPLRLYHDNHWGMVALLSMMVPVKFADIFAFGFGKLIGRYKFAPMVSPGKTVEGVIGGFVGGLIGTLIVFFGLLPLITGEWTTASWWVLVLFGATVTGLGIVGDLVASVLKRDGGQKDSSRWLPGLGGVLDIIDSPLAVTPAVLAFWLSGALGPH